MLNKFIISLFIISIIQNVNSRKSTYCPKVEPMQGFKWEPVKYFFLNLKKIFFSLN